MNPTSIAFAKSTASSLTTTIMDIIGYYNRLQQSNKSFVEQTKLVRIEPSCLVDMSLRGADMLADLQATLLNLFSGFYVQAIAIAMSGKEVNVASQLAPFVIDSTKIANKDIKTDLAKKVLNTVVNKTAEMAMAQEDFTDATAKYLKQKDYQGHLSSVVAQSVESYLVKQNSYQGLKASLESLDKNLFTGRVRDTVSQEGRDENVTGVKTSLDSILDDRFAVGKVVNVQISETKKDGDKDVTKTVIVPIGIRMMTGYVRNNHLVELLSFGQKDISELDRKMAYKLGKIDFVKDVIFCKDLYKQFRKDLMRDKTGYLKAQMERASEVSLYKLFSGKDSGAHITSTAILTEATAKALEQNLNISLDNFQKRNQLMEITGCMMLCVVNEDHRMVRIYFHSMEKYMDASFNDLKVAGKKEPDITAIAQLLAMGQVPRF